MDGTLYLQAYSCGMVRGGGKSSACSCQHCPSTKKQLSSYGTLKFIYRIVGNICGAQISFFLFSVYQNENLTHKTYIMKGVLSCVKWTTKIKQISWR